MEMLQLRYFYESAENGSFAKTAEKYMVPATSVSASVKRLEKELDCALFDRTSNRIVLNDKGRKLKESLTKIFDELDRTVDILTSSTADTRSITMLVRAMRGEITGQIIEYKTRHPHIAFKTVFDFEDTHIEDYDIIIDEETDKYDNYERIPLYTTTLTLRVAKNSPLCHQKLTLKQLAERPFISIGEKNGLHRILLNACRKAGFEPNIIVQSNDLLCNRKFIEAGVGIGISREYPGYLLPEGIELLDVNDFHETQTICAYYKKQAAYGNVSHFLNFLQKNACR